MEKYADAKGSLITILQKAQDLYGYLPVDLLAYIAAGTGVKPAKVLGVVTFYTQFRTSPVGKNLILLCQGTACHVNGSAAIEDAIKEELCVNEGEITPDGLFSDGDSLLDDIAAMKLKAGDDLSILRQIAKSLIDSGCGKNAEVCDELKEILNGVSVGEDAQIAADMILKTRKAVFVFDKKAVSGQGARLIADIAVMSGHDRDTRNGIVQLLPGANSQGFKALGVSESGYYQSALLRRKAWGFRCC